MGPLKPKAVAQPTKKNVKTSQQQTARDSERKNTARSVLQTTSKINGATCESEAETTKRLEGYGRTQIDIKNWIESKNEQKVWGELNRENGDFTVHSSVKSENSNIEITGEYKCKLKD